MEEFSGRPFRLAWALGGWTIQPIAAIPDSLLHLASIAIKHISIQSKKQNKKSYQSQWSKWRCKPLCGRHLRNIKYVQIGPLSIRQCLPDEALLCRERLGWFWDTYQPQEIVDCYSEVAMAPSEAPSGSTKSTFIGFRKPLRRLSSAFRN